MKTPGKKAHQLKEPTQLSKRTTP